ncbi:helix-turn-helix domain-containing protein [Candidatus Nitrotoga arctica]|uniref:Schlafen AlbA-2 domain-containing protein n=1 Tax=Candidatus Nitrotoga arctica TaxID=453162 RepID=A0ABM8Z062_9PROT|nr:ATP-binding protein [Candidatus Nitrotoga arctica]CAG9933166.1 protein of unknown function [Candidatus Nitrotoga arctica]
MNHKEPFNEAIKELILAGESDSIEFKSTLRYDLREKGINKKLEYVIAKTLSAFMNSEGGHLFIGIDDNQNALGLDNDIETLSNKSIDGFELQVIEVIKKYIGSEYSSHIKITFPVFDETRICHVKTSKSSKPIFIRHGENEEFFVRIGCSSQPLLIRHKLFMKPRRRLLGRGNNGARVRGFAQAWSCDQSQQL